MTETWEPVGHIKADGEALKITVGEIVGFIDPAGVGILLDDGKAQIFNSGVRIGRARRSRSGKGIVVALDGAPRCGGSWLYLEDLLEGIRPYVGLSIFRAGPSSGEPAPE